MHRVVSSGCAEDPSHLSHVRPLQNVVYSITLNRDFLALECCLFRGVADSGYEFEVV
jgi:hypothetical protein